MTGRMRASKTLHEYQEKAIDWLYERDSALALLPVGAGKSVIGWTLIAEMMDEGLVDFPLVMAPLRVSQLVWGPERDEWEHLKGRPIVEWGGEPSSWANSIWKQSRILWGQRTTAESLLPGVGVRVRTKLDKEVAQKVKESAGAAADEDNQGAHVVAYYQLRHAFNPNQLREAVDAVRIPLEEKLARIITEERRVNKELRRTTPARALHVTSYENLTWLCELFAPGEWPFDMLMLDECGKLKNPKSPRYKALRKHTLHTKYVYGLNATPAPEGMADLFTQVQLVVGPDLWGKSFYAWRQKYFVPVDYDGRDWRLQLGAKDLLMKDLNTIAFRVDEEQLSYQKSMSHSQIQVELPPKARELYTEMERHMALEIEGHGDIVAMSAASASMKLRQLTSGFIYDENGKAHIVHEEKQHALADLIDSMGKEPLIVCYEFSEELEAIRRVWKNVAYLGQGLSSAKAKDTIDKWNRRELPVMAIHCFSAGHGLNLQAGGSHMAWMSLPWPLESWLQTLGRIDRQGQRRACYSHSIVAKDSMDQRVYDALTMKDAEQTDIIRAIRKL